MSEQQPMYRAYSVVERQNDLPFWLNIGTAFHHKDGKGLNVFLQALPLTGKLVLRLPNEGPPEEAKPDATAKGKRRLPGPEQA